MRVLILLAKHKDETTAQAALNREIPRPEYLLLQEALQADLLDFSDVERSTDRRVVLARRRSLSAGLAMLGFSQRHRYDHFYCTGEDIGMPFGVLMCAIGALRRITLVIHNGGTKARRVIFRVIPSAVWRHVICLSQEQRRVLVDEVGLPAAKVHLFPQWLDTAFYDPDRVPAGAAPIEPYAMACGRESRDYPTLEQAVSELPQQVLVVASGWAPHAGFATATDIRTGGNIRVEAARLSYVELRERYARARLIVVPAKWVTYAAGVTSITEAMSMGKAVIATSSPGTRDYVEDGITGAVVPTADPIAMRTAIQRLWDDAPSLARIGARNRAFALEHFSVEKHGQRVAALLGITPARGPLTAVYDVR